MKPVCVQCKLFYTIQRNGIYFEEGMPTINFPEFPRDPSQWGSYKLWVGDLYQCRGCGSQIIMGMPQYPKAEHYQADYKEQIERLQPLIRVDDC